MKKIIGLLLSVSLIFSMPLTAMAKTTVTFSYPDGAFDDEEMNASVVYDDSYFSKKATRRNDSLALLSVGAASAVYNKDDIKAFLQKCGFTNKRDTVKDSNNDNLSFNFGKKKIGKKTVVAVILQGTATKNEWESNLRLGTTTVHEGFNTTEKEVHTKLNTFLKKNKLKKGSVKFWVTGHSRGAAVGNIMAKRLSDTYGKENVYAYTFASPKVAKVSSKSAKKYTNIFNYVNPDDIVTELPTKDSKTLIKDATDKGVELPKSIRDSEINVIFGTYRRFGKDIAMSLSDHDTMVETFGNITGAEFDSTDVAYNHCQSCYISWLMG